MLVSKQVSGSRTVQPSNSRFESHVMKTHIFPADLFIFLFISSTVHLGTIRVHNQLDAVFNVYISLLYMLRATQCSSSGESIVSIHHPVYITMCRWPSGMQVLSDLHTQSDTCKMIYWYNWFSWWWALSCSKRVEKWNKHIKKSASSWLSTRTHSYSKCYSFHNFTCSS